MRKPLENMSLFKSRRDLLKNTLKGSALVLSSAPEFLRNHDVAYPYRQESNFYYLTGWEEPESIFIYRPGMVPETVMFVRKKDSERETWDGFRYGPQGCEEFFQVEKAYLIDEFEEIAPTLLREVESIHYRLYLFPWSDLLMEKVLLRTKALMGRTGRGLPTVYDSHALIGEHRVIKSEPELNSLREACEITAQGHIAAMKFTRPGVNERQIQGVLSHHFFMNGAAREGYGFIVASGNNATTLHYNFNDQICKDGELLLIDAGAEFKYYTGDVTRTFPVNGKFTEAQADIYQAVLDVQKKIISVLKPGVLFRDLHEMGNDLLTEAMLSLGLLSGRKEDLIQALQHKKYYPHGIGHWLGMDVHDAGLYFQKDKPRALEENMCFTIEPGLYIPNLDSIAPEKYRGIGVRIEDNIRITANGYENMTASVPKEMADIEKLMAFR